jgi:L-gulonolactone oxidase
MLTKASDAHARITGKAGAEGAATRDVLRCATVPEWANWSGRVRARPTEVTTPASEDELAAIVAAATASGRRVRARGTGHSNTPLCATDDVLIAPDGMSGVVEIAADGATARVHAGTVLADLSAVLHSAGVAMHNLGDIDVQTIAGAIGTATHGTGRSLGNLTTAVVGARVVLADGAVVACDAATHGDVFAALLPSLGAIGVVSEFTLALRPTYRLHERVWFGDGAAVLNTLDAHIAATRHYEFFWYPHRDLVEHKALAETEAPPDPLPDRKRERIDHWNRVLPSRREVQFNEMEYSLPAAAGPIAFAQLRAHMLERWADVAWPVEYRTVAADDLWLSPHSGRESVTISVHQGADLPCDEMFAGTETILRDHGGRPHWGKVNTATPADLANCYPRWGDWWAIRDRLDPADTFLNPYLESLRPRSR